MLAKLSDRLGVNNVRGIMRVFSVGTSALQLHSQWPMLSARWMLCLSTQLSFNVSRDGVSHTGFGIVSAPRLSIELEELTYLVRAHYNLNLCTFMHRGPKLYQSLRASELLDWYPY